MWTCDSCGVENDLDPEVEEGQFMSCAECGAEFEVISLDPLELEEIELPEATVADDDDVDEDWSDED